MDEKLVYDNIMNVLELANKGPQGPRPEGRLMSKAVGCCHGNESVYKMDRS